MSQALANEESDLITAIACMSMYFIGGSRFSYSCYSSYGNPWIFRPYCTLCSCWPYWLLLSTRSLEYRRSAEFVCLEGNEPVHNSPHLNEQEVYYNIQGFTDCDNGSEVTLCNIMPELITYENDDPGSPEPGNQGSRYSSNSLGFYE